MDAALRAERVAEEAEQEQRAQSRRELATTRVKSGAAAAAADRADGGGGTSVCGAEREGTTRPLVMATENGVCRG